MLIRIRIPPLTRAPPQRRVCKHIEAGPKERGEVVNLKGAKGGSAATAAPPGAGTGNAPSTSRDTSRLKGLLLELKSDQQAPCLEA